MPPAWRGARAQQARVLGLFLTESKRSGAQAHCTRRLPHEARARAGTWEHGLVPKRGGFSLVQCLSEAYGASAASAARRVRASKAHMLRLLPRESERSGAQAPHAQATSTSEGQGWHVGARPCTEGGRLLARAVPFRNACSESDQRGAARARIKRACCASSQQRVSAVARYTRYTRKPPHQVRARAGTWEHGLAPKKGGFSLVQCHSIAHGANATSVARRARATSARAGPLPNREQAQWRTSAAARSDHPTKRGPELARGSTALH